MPLISVVMITYQHEKYIAEAIQSVLGYLKLVGIRTTIHYPIPSHLFGAYVKDKSLFGNFPIFDKISNMSLRFLLDNY